MKPIIRVLLIASLSGMLISNLLMTHLTAPNPTGRRYSSETPLITGQGSSKAIGQSAETILSKDLGLPNNNNADQNQCICSSSSQSRRRPCKSCLVVLSSLSTYRVPDFIGRSFIAESKNEEGLLYSGREVSQIQDYVLAAILMQAKLWVYVRVNTDVASEFIQLVRSTGGDVVYYFTVPGYIDPLDTALRTIFIVSCFVLVAIGLGLWASYYFTNRPIIVSSPRPPRAPRQPSDPVGKAVGKTESAEDFARRSKEKRQQEIEDSRDD